MGNFLYMIENMEITEINRKYKHLALMHLNMAEREPQNKQNVFEGFMRGLISRSSYQKCSYHDVRRIATNPAS